MVKKIKVYKNFKINNSYKNSIILIGNFDGLHSGHQKLFKQAKKFKKKLNLWKYNPHGNKAIYKII